MSKKHIYLFIHSFIIIIIIAPELCDVSIELRLTSFVSILLRQIEEIKRTNVNMVMSLLIQTEKEQGPQP